MQLTARVIDLSNRIPWVAVFSPDCPQQPTCLDANADFEGRIARVGAMLVISSFLSSVVYLSNLKTAVNSGANATPLQPTNIESLREV